MAPSQRRAAALALHAALLDLVDRIRPSTIGGYVPVGAEPGGPDLPSVLEHVGRLLLPILLPDSDLDWAAYDGSLASGPRGLLHPAGPALGVEAIREAALVVVPALAVDRSGMRLGRGGGSYDRVLARVADSVPTVALLYDGEVLDVVPGESHDRRVGAAITPGGGVEVFRTGVEWTK